MPSHTNALIHESSPYLQQHAHNPVNWYPWGEEALQKARVEDKLLIISIGYSACHWCHVMEKEVFEDSAAAELMNAHFISVKVDREERPDIDEVYMTALQLMTGQGGWPLNVVALPDGRPVWGATYVPSGKWQQVLSQLVELKREEPAKMEDYASRLTEGVQQSQLVSPQRSPADFERAQLQDMVKNWRGRLDTQRGGPDRAPKFPMPTNYDFLMSYALHERDSALDTYVRLTLDKMSQGGIYDQLGGGFARYSVDADWRVPHFEKMLYDNAQLMALYARAWKNYGEEQYARIVDQTFDWLQREMLDEQGCYYSAIDADSEGEEGKFYCWTEAELRQLIPDEEWSAFKEYYDLDAGRWESKIILIRSGKSERFPLVQKWQEALFDYREKRERPGLDDKSLTSWNAMMISGLCEAHMAFGHRNPEFRKQAIRTADWILRKQQRPDGRLWHNYKDGRSSVEGLIEDYAFSIQAFIDLYEVSGKGDYLRQAESWLNLARRHFEDTATGLFFTRDKELPQLIARSMETADNVIPAANSVMAHNLFRLHAHLQKPAWHEQALHMLHQLDMERLTEYGESYSHWGRLMLRILYPHYEIAVSGPDAEVIAQRMQQEFLPQVIWAFSESEEELPLLVNRYSADRTLIYLCQDMSCKLPQTDAAKTLQQIRMN